MNEQNIFFFTSILLSFASYAQKNTMLLCYDKPTSDWQGALPLGNGRMGAMVYGGTADEIIQLNEETLWSGQPYNPNNPEALVALPIIQNLLFKGKQREAEAFGLENFIAIPLRQQKHQTVGELNLKFNGYDSPSNYRCELNLDEAIVPVSYSVDSVIKPLNNIKSMLINNKTISS